MSDVYLLKNQHNDFLSKDGEWVSDAEIKTLYRTCHKDEAVNQKVELCLKDSKLRLIIATAHLDEKNRLALNKGNGDVH